MKLPAPSPDALAYSDSLVRRIALEIEGAGGWMGFDRFMELALYAPGMGYYSGGARKFGAAGDFVTAPEISSAFGATLARQAAQVMALSAPVILEVGAGSGRLAADLLRELEGLGALPQRYAILDLSGELRARQQETIAREVPHLLDRVVWLDRLPESFEGLVLANELLDAMPVHLVRWAGEAVCERGVSWQGGAFVWQDRPATGRVLQWAQTLAAASDLPDGYVSEIGLAAADWTSAWGGILTRGVLLLIDYGFPRHEFYHEQRDAGTLMCHYRHHSHGEPFFLPGLQDITAHVDFTAIVEAGHNAGLDFLGYTLQGTFLLNCGVGEMLERSEQAGNLGRLARAREIDKLISPAEMGELFKVMALGRGIADPLIGFAQGDRSETL